MSTLVTKETLRSRPNGYAGRHTTRKSAAKRNAVSRQQISRAPAKRQAVKRRPAHRARPKQTSRRSAPAHNDLPDWADLQADAAPRVSPAESYLAQISTPRFFVLVFALAAACTLYVGHVHATQHTLAMLQETRQDNLRLHLKHNRLKSTYDANTGPAVIYERSAALGLEQSISYGPTIEVKVFAHIKP